MGIRFYNLNGFFVKKLAHGVNYVKVYHRRVTPQEARQLYNQRQDNYK